MNVLLDLDGTVTDSSEGITRCITHALTTMGREVPDALSLRRFLGPPLHHSFAALGLSPADVDRAVTLYRERYTDVGIYENRVYDGVVELLDGIADLGHSIALATSKPEPFALRVLDHFDLTPRFAAVAGATMDATRSAKADVIAHVLRQLPPGPALMVGDRVQDLDGARAHGLRSIGALWGYGEPGELDGADALAVTPADVLALI